MKFICHYLKAYRKYILLNFLSVFGFVLIQIGIPTALALGINNHFNNNDRTYILRLALFMTIFAILGLISLIILAYSTNKLVSELVRDIRNDLFRKIQSFSKDNYDKFGVSRLITNTSTDAYTIMQFLIMLLRIGLIAPTMFIISIFMIFSQSRKLGLITVVSIPTMLFFMYLINTRVRPLSENQQRGLDKINSQIREGLSGIRIIRAFNNEEFMERRFEGVSLDYANLSKKMFQAIALISPIFTIPFTLVVALVIHIGAREVYNGILEYGTLVAFIEYVFHALISFLMLGAVLMMYPRAAVSIRRIEEVLNEEAGISSREDGIKESRIEGYLEFRNVSFSYSDSSEKSVLKNISFKVRPGETMAFIGSTGSGKSTLMKLIPRFVDVTEGEILLDGKDIRSYDLKFLRDQIGYVPQKSVLFSGNIRDNLVFGNEAGSLEDISRALYISQARDFVEDSEEGLDTKVSEGGSNLSGGQRQRLCIARALMRRVPIYIFDDSFAALDYRTDSILRKKLKEEVRGASFFIVAQRVSTIMEADKIMVLDRGEVVGLGSHRELLKSCKVYYQIASSQLSKEELGYE